MQLLLQFASLHQTGNNLQEDPTTRGSELLNLDLRQMNIGPSYACKKTASQEHRHLIVDTAMLKKSMP